jgi:hypothetical protein
MSFRIFVIVILFAASVARACSYCSAGNANLQTFRQEARNSKFVVIGTLTNPRLVGDAGYTDLTIDHVVKNDPAIAKLENDGNASRQLYTAIGHETLQSGDGDEQAYRVMMENAKPSLPFYDNQSHSFE